MSGVVFSILYYSDEGTKSISLATMEYMNQLDTLPLWALVNLETNKLDFVSIKDEVTTIRESEEGLVYNTLNGNSYRLFMMGQPDDMILANEEGLELTDFILLPDGEKHQYTIGYSE